MSNSTLATGNGSQIFFTDRSKVQYGFGVTRRPSPERFWLAQRSRVALAHGTIQLNAGTLSPTPKPVLAAATRLRQRQASAPADFLWRQTPHLINRSRSSLAKFLRCSPNDLLLLPNVTHALNHVVASLQLPRGAEILMTDHEYGAMLFCWDRWARERGWKLRFVKLPYRTENPGDIVSAFHSSITRKTRAIFFSHVTSTTGFVLPATDLCSMARQHGIISVVDGAHAVGMVGVNLTKIGADFYGANCHKWLMTPLGCGFLHVRPVLKSLLKPLITSWGWGNLKRRTGKLGGRLGGGWHFAFEFQGCMDRVPQMVLPEVMAFRQSLGGESAIANRVRELTRHARERLETIGLTIATPRNPELCGSMIAIELSSANPLQLRERLWRKHQLETSVTTADGKNFLRISTAWFTTRTEIDQLAAALKAIEI